MKCTFRYNGQSFESGPMELFISDGDLQCRWSHTMTADASQVHWVVEGLNDVRRGRFMQDYDGGYVVGDTVRLSLALLTGPKLQATKICSRYVHYAPVHLLHGVELTLQIGSKKINLRGPGTYYPKIKVSDL